MTLRTRSDVTTADKFVSNLFWKMSWPSARKTEQLVDTNISKLDDPIGTRSWGSDVCIPTCAWKGARIVSFKITGKQARADNSLQGS